MSDPFDTVREALLQHTEGYFTQKDMTLRSLRQEDALAALAEIERELRLWKAVSFANGDDYRKQYDRAEKAEAERDAFKAALRLLANPDGVFRSGDLTATRIPPHEIARRVLGGGSNE